MKKSVKVAPIVRMVVDRCHVGDSNRRVIRYVISRLKKKHRGFRAMSRSQRRDLLRQIVTVHTENRELYRDVMRGF
jgi:hypothetical protein